MRGGFLAASPWMVGWVHVCVLLTGCCCVFVCCPLSRNQVNREIATKAFDALLAYHTTKQEEEGRTSQLLGDDEQVYAQVVLKKIPGNPGVKPIHVSLPHSSRGGEGCDVCLIVKDDDAEWAEETLIDQKRAPSVKEVISLDRLRREFARFEQRRTLLATYDLFMADDRILPMLTKALGKTFLSRKKQPIPVRMARKQSVARAIEAKVHDTHFVIRNGTNVSVCIGVTDMESSELVDNLVAAIDVVAEKVPRKWSNIQAIQVKTTNSIALPILNKHPFVYIGGGGRRGATEDGAEDRDEVMAEEEEDQEVRTPASKRTKTPTRTKAKGKAVPASAPSKTRVGKSAAASSAKKPKSARKARA